MFRVFTKGVGIVATLVLTAGVAAADQWPSKMVRVIIPFSAGSAADVVPRIVFEQLQAQTKQPFVIENRPGGAFTIGVGAAKSAPADGYTILAHSNGFVTTPAVQPVNWDPTKDFSGVTTMADVPMVLVISPDKKVDTLQQLVAQAKAKPGSLNYATAGLGAPTHLAMERLRLAAGITGQLIPFKGASEALTEVMAGRVDVYFSPLAASMPLIQSGKLKPLAVSGTKRAAALPDVPTTTEAGFKDSDFAFYVGMFVPKDTPRDLVDRMNAEVKKVLAMPSIQEKIAKIGSEATSSDPEAFDKRIAEEFALTKSLVEAAGITVK